MNASALTMHSIRYVVVGGAKKLLKELIAEAENGDKEGENDDDDEDMEDGEEHQDEEDEEGGEEEDEERAEDGAEETFGKGRFVMEMSDDEEEEAGEKAEKTEGNAGAEKKEKRVRKKKVEVDERSLQRFKEDMGKRGVIYISRVPPFMKPLKIRHYFAQFGKIDRVYLTPEG